MEDFVTYEQAIQLKELGFNYRCNHIIDRTGYVYEESEAPVGETNYHDFNTEEIYTDCVSCPTLSQAQKWLREVKEITILVNLAANKETYITKKLFYFKWFNSEFIFCGFSKCHYNTYEQALSEGISTALKMLKKQENE